MLGADVRAIIQSHKLTSFMTKTGTDTEFLSFYLCRADIKITSTSRWEPRLLLLPQAVQLLSEPGIRREEVVEDKLLTAASFGRNENNQELSKKHLHLTNQTEDPLQCSRWIWS